MCMGGGGCKDVCQPNTGEGGSETSSTGDTESRQVYSLVDRKVGQREV